jgi:hypothetical protein
MGYCAFQANITGFSGSLACEAMNLGPITLVGSPSSCVWNGSGWQLFYGPVPAGAFFRGTTSDVIYASVLTNGALNYYFPGMLDGTGPWDFKFQAPWFRDIVVNPISCTIPSTITVTAASTAAVCPGCCNGNPIPDTLHVTYFVQTENLGNCPCTGGGPGTTISLTRDPVDHHWKGTGPWCGGTVAIDFWLCFGNSGGSPPPICDAYLHFTITGPCDIAIAPPPNPTITVSDSTAWFQTLHLHGGVSCPPLGALFVYGLDPVATNPCCPGATSTVGNTFVFSVGL